MQSDDQIAEAWTTNRPYLIDLAFRMLGDIGAAEDVVQEAFFRLVQTPLGGVDDARGWLIVVTSRLCLDHIKSAPWRRERPADMAVRSDRDRGAAAVDPADRVTLDDEVRLALLVMLERLTPAERVAFVLHDIFGLPFDLVAETVGRPSTACRQLASRARRKVRESCDAGRAPIEPAGHRTITRRFIAACASGDLDELLAVLDPNASGELDSRKDFVVVGAARVARNLLRFWSRPGLVLVSQPIDGHPAVLAFAERQLVGVIDLTISDSDVITIVHVHTEEASLSPLRAQLFGAV
ncbi:RNA polymerase sigma factor SigI [Mycolicibacterium moriokaense]|uniref:RNA polymerase sigma-70 factor (ECF subfamily) n=1 Tax=Mycolicibacterium moriokaense TaxID=39691 RepID=A0A318HIL9_9MYCO|nr:RNA polymerase sigma factor SigI [Mycolicibacterium moriokaense]PXX09685.1 RNA polymerase sigma-70 factor (ECF subfamily) [Mycolicibacterium moriokaense]